MNIAIGHIRDDGGTQSRARLDGDTIRDYAEAMLAGTEFPPVTLYYDGKDYWLADGFHRLDAARRAGVDSLGADVRQGTRRDAVLFSVGANSGHGLRRTNADKRRAVETLLSDEEWRNWSDHEIARKCAVGHDLVRKLRSELSLAFNASERTYTTKHGTQATMKTSNIGAKPDVIPSLPDDAPLFVQDSVDNGEMSKRDGQELADALRDAPTEVIDVIARYGVVTPGLVPKLIYAFNHRLDTWSTITSTGTIDGERSITDVSPTEFDGYLERAAYEHRKRAVEERRQRLIDEAKEATLDPQAKYRIIYADPPWQYDNSMPDYFGEQADHYPTMPIADILALPVADMVEDNAVLFLWATAPNIQQGLDVVKAWGFRYVAQFIWDKEHHVMGHYNSVRHELLLIAVRGSCQPDHIKLMDSVYTERATEHSRKPDYFRQVIDTLYPYGKRIELFARRAADGWEVFGNELASA